MNALVAAAASAGASVVATWIRAMVTTGNLRIMFAGTPAPTNSS